jgi:hypothetical protein
VCFKYRINNKEKIKEIDLLLTVEKIVLKLKIQS